MSAHTDQLERIRTNLLTEIEKETAYRARNGPKPTYTANGRTVDWNGWLKAMMDQVKDLTEQIDVQANQDDPYELRTTGYV